MPTTIHLPLGIDNFSKLRQDGNYYIDKTGFIKELMNESFEVNLITRPRRFGKTLTMSMLEDFFDISRDASADFEGLEIMEEKEICAQWMNQWPTIFLTLKSVNGINFQSAYGMFSVLIADLCKKYSFLEYSERVNPGDKRIYTELTERKADEVDVKNSLYTLTRMLSDHYGKPVILLIDEYDVPLSKASDQGYYVEMLDVIRAMFDKVLKSNEFLKFAVITGCLKIAKESIFTGTNNFVSDTISRNRFDEYIGFTERDVRRLLVDSGFHGHAKCIRASYGGYCFGSVMVYCPWDILNYLAELQVNQDSEPESYWGDTSHNNIIRTFIERKDLWEEEQINEDFETLLAGGTIIKTITENLTYDTVHSSADNLWSLLYLTGYLTQDPHVEGIDRKRKRLALKIPNEEIRQLFHGTVKEWFRAQVKATDRTQLFLALWRQDEQTISELLSDMIYETITYYKEDYYLAFVAGALSFAGYKVTTNEERREVDPDILLKDVRNGRAMILIITSTDSYQDLEAGCLDAIHEMDQQRHADRLGAEYQEVLGYGVCFYQKKCMVRAVKYR